MDKYFFYINYLPYICIGFGTIFETQDIEVFS